MGRPSFIGRLADRTNCTVAGLPFSPRHYSRGRTSREGGDRVETFILHIGGVRTDRHQSTIFASSVGASNEIQQQQQQQQQQEQRTTKNNVAIRTCPETNWLLSQLGALTRFGLPWRNLASFWLGLVLSQTTLGLAMSLVASNRSFPHSNDLVFAKMNATIGHNIRLRCVPVREEDTMFDKTREG